MSTLFTTEEGLQEKEDMEDEDEDEDEEEEEGISPVSISLSSAWACKLGWPGRGTGLSVTAELGGGMREARDSF